MELLGLGASVDLLPSGRSHFLPQLTNEVERYAFQYETKMNSSDSTVVLYLEKVRQARCPLPGLCGPQGRPRNDAQHPGQ